MLFLQMSFAEVSKEVRNVIAPQYRASVVRNHQLHHLFIIDAVLHTCRLDCTTKFKTTKINSAGFAYLFMKSNTPKITNCTTLLCRSNLMLIQM